MVNVIYREIQEFVISCRRDVSGMGLVYEVWEEGDESTHKVFGQGVGRVDTRRHNGMPLETLHSLIRSAFPLAVEAFPVSNGLILPLISTQGHVIN